MTEREERLPLESILGDEALDVRAARVERLVRSRVAALEPGPPPGGTVLAVLGPSGAFQSVKDQHLTVDSLAPTVRVRHRGRRRLAGFIGIVESINISPI